MTEHVLPYDHSIVPQETFWDCGPAAAQTVLNTRGIKLTETTLIPEIGTTENGTDNVGLIEHVLDQRLPDAEYTTVYLPDDPPTPEQRETLWRNIVGSINAGYGVVMNWVAPPSNYPRGVKGSDSPKYNGGTVFHYVAAMGYDDTGARAVWIADSGFAPYGYWISFDQCASLIPPKGYSYAAASMPVTMTDTLFADVSEFQVPVDDSYPYKVLSIRICDGTRPDKNFATNYAWMRKALDDGRLVFGIVYTYVRPDIWQDNATTVRNMLAANGGLHPRVALMLDVESGGNPAGDQSEAINKLFNALSTLTAVTRISYSPARIIGYGNVADLNRMWPNKPDGIRLIVAAYGSNPPYPGKVAHQYTDGTGYGHGLPDSCPPFGDCDMNSADGLDPWAFAAACGITDTVPVIPNPPAIPKPDNQAEQIAQIWDQLLLRWDILGGHTVVETLAELLKGNT